MDRTSFGGQAVIEGVMIRGARGLAIAVRKPNGEIAVERRVFTPATQRYAILRLPFIRGVMALYYALVIGIDALLYSANQAAESEAEQVGRPEMIITTTVSFVIALALFVLLPTWIVHWSGLTHPLALNALEGGVRLAVLIGYVALISRMPDIRRVLEYHGAEHKAIHALEREGRVTLETVRPQSVLHPRCGTSFLLLVALVSLITHLLFGWPDFWLRLAVRLGTLPLVAGIAYEFIRASGRAPSAWWWRPVVAPGMWLQRFTTREPDDAQMEVAIAALDAALALDAQTAAQPLPVGVMES